MKIIGVTGGLGTGKSTVTAMFGKLGARVLDADEMVHELLAEDKAIFHTIIRKFGKGITVSSGAIDRKRLAVIVFRSRKRLNELCDIIHPKIIREIKKEIVQLKKKKAPCVIIDAPLLVEAGLVDLVDFLVVVKTNKKIQLTRIQESRHVPLKDSEQRIKNQIPLREKIKLADFVIDNNGTRKETLKQVERIWKKIM